MELTPQERTRLARGRPVDPDAHEALLSRERYVSPFNLALIYGGLRDNARTLALLEEAESERSQSMNLLVLSPAFDGVRADPPFAALVRHIGLLQ